MSDKEIEQIIIDKFDLEKINYDPNYANYIDDVYSAVKDSIILIVREALSQTRENQNITQ